MSENLDLTRPRCYYYQKGSCTKQNCTFMHDNLVKARPPMCTNWENGNCRYENSCKFYHGCSDEQDIRDLPPVENKNQSQKIKGPSSMNWRRSE
jgi:hypothetical protein